jgi:WD40 repeat protein
VDSVAFSHDSAQLASASYDNTVKIWDVSSGACLQTVSVGKSLYISSFDSTTSFLRTDIGTIIIQNSIVSSIRNIAELKRPLYVSTSLSSDTTWIRHNGTNMLWVPSEYRPSCSSIYRSIVSIGVGSRKV